VPKSSYLPLKSTNQSKSNLEQPQNLLDPVELCPASQKQD
jgi:hypothetical protein